MAELTIKKIINHSWYLREEITWFSIFYYMIDNNIKTYMAKRLLENVEFGDDLKKISFKNI